MNELLLTVTVLGTLFALLASGVWIGLSLLITGFVAVFFFAPTDPGQLLAISVWDASWSWAMTALPLFIWMGEILFRTRLSEDMFKGLSPWLGWLPGRLLHVNILGCGVMAAVSGSSAVTCATIGRMSFPELASRRYPEAMAIGTLAGSGTLGLLIPPSIMMIVYGIITQTSIGRLFI
ncbi:MAG: TRAP transporter large permease subunit, partial [Acetobacteraceae bacterium]